MQWKQRFKQNSDAYAAKYKKIKFNSDDELNKMTEIPSMIMVVRAIFLKSNRYYLEVSLDECLYKT